MIIVYHLESSRSQRVLWLLEELGAPYRVERFARDATGRAPAAYREVHALGKSPVIRDGEVLLAESGAIVEHLVERYGAGRLAPPPGDPARPRFLFWLHFAEGTAMAFLVTGIVLGMTPDGGGPMRDVFAKEVRRILEFVERELGDGPWLLGSDFSAADVMMGYVADVAARRGDLAGLPRLGGYVERLRARPAHRRAEEIAAAPAAPATGER
jgi:glutathione S-transferase